MTYTFLRRSRHQCLKTSQPMRLILVFLPVGSCQGLGFCLPTRRGGSWSGKWRAETVWKREAFFSLRELWHYIGQPEYFPGPQRPGLCTKDFKRLQSWLPPLWLGWWSHLPAPGPPQLLALFILKQTLPSVYLAKILLRQAKHTVYSANKPWHIQGDSC